MNYVGQIQLDETIGRIQGAKVHNGALYAASDNDEKSVYKIDLETGHVEELFRILDLPGTFAADPFLETEGMAFYEGTDGSTMHVILIQSIFPTGDESDPSITVMPSSTLYNFALVE